MFRTFLFLDMDKLEFIEHIKFPFPVRQQVAWGEMDAFNHINNVIYFRYFETGRVEFFNQTDLWKTFIDEEIRIVVGKLECNYIREITHPSEIEIGVGIKKIGNTSLVVHHVVRCKGEIAAHGEGIIVATDPATGKSKPWSDKLRNEFSQWL